ncbi:MAG TPA: ROK family protein [Cellvibrionaceae bacterium]
MTHLRIGIDLGGTKTEVIVLNGSSHELFRRRLPTPRDDYPQTLATIVRLVTDAEQAVGAADLPVGVGIPGTVSRKTGCVKNANSTWLNGQPMQQHLIEMLARQVQVSNDANCLAVSEATDGAGADFDWVFAAILGTGCGGGLCYQKKPLAGPNGLAGEWGHNPLPWTDQAALLARPCYCGKSGCQETFLSGTGLGITYQQQSAEVLTGAEVMARVEAGEAVATQVLDTYIEHLAQGLAGVINMLDPDVIVLGGGACNIQAIYREIPTRLARYVFGGECDTPIKQAVHGDSSGVRGAAWLNPL